MRRCDLGKITGLRKHFTSRETFNGTMPSEKSAERAKRKEGLT